MGYESIGERRSGDRCILVIDSGYFLTREVVRALKAEGIRTVVIPLQLPDGPANPDSNKYTAFLQSLVHAAVYMRPDALLTVNHLGFDAAGRLTELLEKMKLPAIVWYVDSPRYILLDHLSNVSDRVGIFLWDGSYEPWMRQIGYKKVHVLPLATDPEIFFAEQRASPLNDAHVSAGESERAAPLVFVGDSMAFAVDKAFRKLPSHMRPDSSNESGARVAAFVERFCETALSLSNYKRKPAWEIFSELVDGALQESGPDFHFENGDGRDHQQLVSDETARLNLESALVLEATRRQRIRFIEDIAGSLNYGKMVIYGDDGWNKVLNGSASVLPPVDYYRDLARVYRRAGAVINLTGLQMPHALNQRCYDVPAAGGFLLTDVQEALYEQFEPDREVVACRSADELLDKWNYFSRGEDERRALIERGRRRILQEHTYRHRIREMLKVAESWFA